MKKKLALLLMTSLLVVAFAACGKDGEADTQTSDSSQVDVSTEQSDEGQLNQEVVETISLAEVKVEDYVTLGNYKGLEISYSAKETFTQEDVDALAISAYEGYITGEAGSIKDRAAVIGDIVNIDFVGVMDGVAFEGGTSYGYDLELGSGSFIAGFEEGVAGMMPGETKDLELSFPAKYDPNPDLAGKAVTFTTKLNYIYPIIDSVDDMKDEVFAALNYPEYTNVEEFMAFCQEYYEYSVEENYKAGKQEAVLNALFELATFTEVPQGLVQYYYNDVYASLQSQAMQYGLDMETFCAYFVGADASTAVSMFAEETAQSAMIFQYVANAENLNVSEEELDGLIAQFAEENDSTVEEVLQNASREELRVYFMNDKVVEFVLANGNCTELPIE